MWHPRGDICCFHFIVFFISSSVVDRDGLLVFRITTLTIPYDSDDYYVYNFIAQYMECYIRIGQFPLNNVSAGMQVMC